MLKKTVAETGYQLIIDKGETSAEGVHMEHADHHQILKEAEAKLLWKKFLVGAILSAMIWMITGDNKRTHRGNRKKTRRDKYYGKNPAPRKIS
jgi:hypothetical protein